MTNDERIERAVALLTRHKYYEEAELLEEAYTSED